MKVKYVWAQKNMTNSRSMKLFFLDVFAKLLKATISFIIAV